MAGKPTIRQSLGPSTDDRPIADNAASAYAYPLLLKYLLKTALASASGQEIVYRDLVRHDYPTFAKRVAQLASGLTSCGVRHGDTVGMLDWDSHRYLEAYFAIPGMGAVLHMVNVRLSPEQILYTINHARDDALLVHVDFLPMLETIWDRIETVRCVILLTDDGVLPASNVPITSGYEEMLAGAVPEYLFPDFDENSRATTFYTTGTTGLPKGVFFSHRQLVLHTLAAATALATASDSSRLHRSDVYMPITPMFHVHAWGMPFVATMLGMKQVYPGRYSPEMLLRLQQNEGVTLSHCVPTILQMLLSNPLADGCDLTGWKMIIGGSVLTKGMAGAALERGINVFAGYGMSETCPILTIARPMLKPLDGSSTDVEARTRAGRPIPLVDIQIIDPAVDRIEHGSTQPGEIIVRAPWLTQGYIRDPANSETLWAGGYLHTGDIGVVHHDGSLQITDRLKDVIKTGGEWVSSLEIEDLIQALDGISEVAVIGVPDGKWGERPLAVIVKNRDNAASVTAESIKAHFNAHCERGTISKWAIPSSIFFVAELPKTSVGKLDKKTLRQRYGHASK